jgi:response regulator RpfG family c-di-GMP phosphodiesterase
MQPSETEIKIREAVDGEKAFQEIETARPDLIFMDIRLPGENGLELTKKVKSRYPNILAFDCLTPILYQTLQGGNIFFRHARGNLILFQTFEALTRFVEGSAHILPSTVREKGHDDASIQLPCLL